MSPVSSPRPVDDEKRAAFLYELLRDANTSLAAARANLNRGTVYRWKLEDPEFAALWAEIVASRPRRRDLRRRVSRRANRRETSQLASHGTIAGTPREAARDKDFGPAFQRQW